MVKCKIDWSIDAKSDLIDILQFYIDRNGSSTYSKKLYKKINKTVNKLIRNPFLGIKTDFESVRFINTGDFQIIYEIIDETILIIMIWDCRRNPETKHIDKRIK